MKFTIGQLQTIVSKSGKEFKKFNVKDEQGNITNDVVAFGYFSKYPELATGVTVEAILKKGEPYNGKDSYSLVDVITSRPSFFGGPKASEAKAQNIAKAQERKEEGVMISSTARMATEIALAFKLDGDTPEDFKTSWQKWREWAVKNWENTNAKDLTSIGKPVPFNDDINPEDIPF